jgi:hypothetical protein
MPRTPLHPGSAQELKFAVLEELRRLKKDSEKVLVAFVQGAGNELHGEDDNKLLQFLLTHKNMLQLTSTYIGLTNINPLLE